MEMREHILEMVMMVAVVGILMLFQVIGLSLRSGQHKRHLVGLESL